MAASSPIIVRMLWLGLFIAWQPKALAQMGDSLGAAYTQLPAKVLKVGEAFQVQLRSGQKIFISRKGYLAIHQLAGEEFRLIALKKGELVVLVKSRSDQVVSQRTVLIRSSAPAPKGKAPPLPSDCHGKGVRCRQGLPAIISGNASSWQQFFALRRWCQRQRCGFRLRLSEKARQQYARFAGAALGRRIRHEVLANGVLSVCRRDGEDPVPEVRQLLDAELWQLPIASQRCTAASPAANYEVEALAFRLKDEDAKRIGLNIAGQSFPLSTWESLRLHAFLADNRSLIIGQPSLTVNAGETSEFATGSEWFIARGDDKGQWKQVGFTIKLKLVPVTAHRVKASYQVTITGPQNGRSTTLDRSYMAATMTVDLGVPQLVARLGTAMSAEQKTGVPLVDSIPIIGPLLRHDVSAKSWSRLFLWLHIKLGAAESAVSTEQKTPLSRFQPFAEVLEPLP